MLGVAGGLIIEHPLILPLVKEVVGLLFSAFISVLVMFGLPYMIRKKSENF